MKLKLASIFGFLTVFFIIAIRTKPLAASGQYVVNLPIIASHGPTWQEVGSGSASGGGISNTFGSSWRPSLAVAPDGTTYAGWWDDTTGDAEIYVRVWNGSSWEEVGIGSASGGGISNNTGVSFDQSLVVALDGILYAAWKDDSSGILEIYVRAWNGSSWEEVGASSASGGGISNNTGSSEFPSLAVAPDGTLYAAWYDNSEGNWEIYVRAWNGSSWEEVGASSASGGGISNNTGSSEFPSLVLAPDGAPYVAWHDDSGGSWEIYVRAWNGSSWEEVGIGSASGGGISNTGGNSWIPSLAVAPDGTLYATWHDDSGGNLEIYVLAWNGSSWEEVGIGSASSGGISNNTGSSEFPSLVVAPDGTLYVAWHDDSGGSWEIYVRAWNGSSWEEVGAGSASGGGISDNTGVSFDPSLVLASDGTPYVAWHDDSGGSWEIYVRRYIE
jgi:hypothetical protein